MVGVVAVGGCGGYVDRYEEGVADFEPIYCYSTLADPTCHRVPIASEERRLVNYFGPHPSRYRPPPPRPAPKLAAPPEGPLYVRDPDAAIRARAAAAGRGPGRRRSIGTAAARGRPAQGHTRTGLRPAACQGLTPGPGPGWRLRWGADCE